MGAETPLQRNIKKALRKRWPHSWWFKQWGGPFTPAGIPDILGCCSGLFFALEVKVPDKKGRKKSVTSTIQDETIDDINNAGGYACVVRSVKEALTFVERSLEDHYGIDA